LGTENHYFFTDFEFFVKSILKMASSLYVAMTVTNSITVSIYLSISKQVLIMDLIIAY
jgi:hypothetical protein